MTTIDPKIKLIHEGIQRFLPGARIILFGSRAKNNFDDRSDYDVLAIIQGEINSRSLQSLQSTGNQQISVENLLILWVQNCKVFCKFDENFAKNEREITRSTTEKFVSSNFN